MSLKLYRSCIEDQVLKVSESRGVDTHEAFLRLVFYLVTGHGYGDLEPEDILDGQGDYQIDALHIDTANEGRAIVTVIQSTFSESLSSTKLIRLHLGLAYLLEKPKSEYSKLSNTALGDAIQEFRDIRAEMLPSNVRIQCYYACLGDPTKAAGEFPEQVASIRSDYGSSAGDFSFEVLGPQELYDLLNVRERSVTAVTEKLEIIYDQNKANLLEHTIENVSGVICTVRAAEIARIVNENPTVFDENLRRFLGFGSPVNQAIRDSCAAQQDAPLFWFLNNGITIVCDDFDVNKDFDKPFINIENLRIVNGCQTATTIARTQKKGELQPHTKVMVRVFETHSTDLASRLVFTTNNQNKITSRDLRAQDKIQEHIRTELERRFRLWYERTPNEYADRSKYAAEEVIANQKVGQAYLAVVQGRPSDSKSRQYKVWGEHYQRIFNPDVYAEAYLLCYQIAQACTSYQRQTLQMLRKSGNSAGIRRVLIANGVYHLARMAAFLWRQGKDWTDRKALSQDIQKLKDEPALLTPYFNTAAELLEDIFNSEKQFTEEPSVALKSTRLDDKISAELYASLGSGSARRARVRP